MTKHLVKKNVTIDGVAQATDEKLCPSLERLIVMEWLHRLDNRLVKFVQEKFSTELNAGSNILITMVETLSKNIDNYITILDASGAIGAVSPHNPSFNGSPYQDQATVAPAVASREAYQYGPHGVPHARARRADSHQKGFQPRTSWAELGLSPGRDS